jgi:hypothetical protein|tara:strand:+ start:270 stop:509 length:240 start_codon:yes stop_codon:yes gene_type:complete
MTDFAQIEKEILELTPAEREQLALRMWESIIADEAATADSNVDREVIKIAHSRDLKIESSAVTPLSEQEFRDRTSGNES